MTTTALRDVNRHRPGQPGQPFLEVRDLRVHFPTDDGSVKSVDGLSFTVDRGRTLGIVGDAGPGKSVNSLLIRGIGLPTVSGGVSPGAKLRGSIYRVGAQLRWKGGEPVRGVRAVGLTGSNEFSSSALNRCLIGNREIVAA